MANEIPSDWMFTTTQPFSFGTDMCAADSVMQSIFAGCREQLSQFMAARARLAGDPTLRQYVPNVRADKLAQGLRGVADGIYKQVATWRKLIDAHMGEVETDALALTNAKNTLSADDVAMVRYHFHKLSDDAQRAWLRKQMDIIADDKSAAAVKDARAGLIAVMTAPRSVDLLDDQMRMSVERSVAGADAWDEIAARRTACQCALEAVDKLTSYVRVESDTVTDPRAVVTSDSQG